MEIPKDQILDLIRSKVSPEQADQANAELPDQVDPEQHAGILGKFGVNPQELLSGGLGGLGSKFGL